jgi:hypothetical protein
MGHLLSPTEHAREEDRCTENDTGGARKGRPNDGGTAASTRPADAFPAENSGAAYENYIRNHDALEPRP